jgi:hypothetical protein
MMSWLPVPLRHVLSFPELGLLWELCGLGRRRL